MRSPRIDCRATSAASIPVRGRRTSATASGCALDARNADATSTKSTSQNEFLSRLKQTSATADREERFVHVVAAVVADEQPFELVQPREGPLDDPAVAAQAGAVRGLATADRWSDPAPAQLAPVLVVVVTAFGAETIRPSPRSARLAAPWRHPPEQRDELGDVVAVAAGARPGERQPGRVYEQMMLGAVSGSINRARARLGA